MTQNTELSQEQLEKGRKIFDAAVDKNYHSYEQLDMEEFIKHLGGYDKVDNMLKINEKLDRQNSANEKLCGKSCLDGKNSSLEEWKQGFMEGFEAAYKRLHNDTN